MTFAPSYFQRSMAKANPLSLLTPLEHNLNPLSLSRNHRHFTQNISRTRNHIIAITWKNQNPNRLGIRIISSLCPGSPRNVRSVPELKIASFYRKYYVHDRGFANLSALSLSSIPHRDYSLCSGRDCFGLPRPSLPPCRQRGLPPLWVPLMSLSGGQSEPVSAEKPTKTMKCVIKGRVQGVFYRDWTVENATQLGLTGWVRNRRDGSVEALFSGKPEAVDEMQQRCRRGPPSALVTAIQPLSCEDEDPGTSFQRKPTV